MHSALHFCRNNSNTRKNRHRESRVKSWNSNPYKRCTFNGLAACFCKRKTAYCKRSDQKRTCLYLPFRHCNRLFVALLLKPCKTVLQVQLCRLISLSIVVSIVFSYIVFKEKLSVKSSIGLVMIIAGTLVMLL